MGNNYGGGNQYYASDPRLGKHIQNIEQQGSYSLFDYNPYEPSGIPYKGLGIPDESYPQSGFNFNSSQTSMNPAITNPAITNPATTSPAKSFAKWLPLGSMILGGIEAYQASNALDELEKIPQPKYEITPEMKNAAARAESRANQGFTGEETAAWRQNLAQSGATAYKRGIEAGGGSQARAIQAGIQGMNINAINNFARMGAERQRQNQMYADSMSKYIQGEKNRQATLDIQRRQQLEQNYGQAMQTGLSQLAGGVDFIASVLL